MMAQAQTASEYHIYAGNTHSHTSNTWSHGEQWAKTECAGILVYSNNAWSDGYVKSKTGCFGIYVINGLQFPSPSMKLKEDSAKFQGSPEEHFRLAKSNGYDFYATPTTPRRPACWCKAPTIRFGPLPGRQQPR